MSEQRGALSAAVLPFLDGIEQHRRLPPGARSSAALGMAASSLAWLVYLRDDVRGFVGDSLAADPLVNAWLPFAVWAGLTGFVGWWLLASWKMAQGPRDSFAALCRLLLAVGCAALLSQQVWPHDWPLAAWFLKGLYLGWLAAQCARFLRAAQLFNVGGSARRAVNRQLRRNQTVLGRPPRLRRPGLLLAALALIGGVAVVLLW